MGKMLSQQWITAVRKHVRGSAAFTKDLDSDFQAVIHWTHVSNEGMVLVPEFKTPV